MHQRAYFIGIVQLPIPSPNKSNLLQCSNYLTIAQVSHAGKILLPVTLERNSPNSKQKLFKNKLDLEQDEALETKSV